MESYQFENHNQHPAVKLGGFEEEDQTTNNAKLRYSLEY